MDGTCDCTDLCTFCRSNHTINHECSTEEKFTKEEHKKGAGCLFSATGTTKEAAKKVKKQLVEGLEIKVQPKHRYAAVHVENPFGNPFVTIPSAYQTLDSFMRVNGLVHTESGVIPCYETNGESMDIYIACG